jgi:endonuclease/exonuclease/phosphatase family metal-dependent hydrolase
MKLITWNIQWGRGADGRVDLDRIVEQARAIADFDVLCLQEVADGFDDLPGSPTGNEFAELARRLPGYAAIEGVAIDLPAREGATRRRFGNMILSRLPVGAVFRHLLPWVQDSAEMSMQRVALEATLATPLGPLRVTTTHLEYYSPTQRMAQVERLIELHREALSHARTPRAGGPGDGPFTVSPRGAQAVLVGDLNFRPDTPEHTRLVAGSDTATTRYLDAWELSHPGQPHDPTVGLHDKAQWPDEPFTFDFALVSEDLAGRVREVRVDARSDGSDHQPMLIEIL